MSQATGQARAKRRPRLLFATLVLGQSAQSLAFTGFVAALPQMAHDWGPRGSFVAQMTMALSSLGMMCGSLASGWVLERAGSRGTLLASFIAFAISGAEGLIWSGPRALLVARFINGFVAALIATTCLWGIAASHIGTKRARGLGISAALSNFTAFAGTLLGGYLARHGGWPAAFAQFPVFGLIGFMLAFASVDQTHPHIVHVGEPFEPFLRRLLPFFVLAMFLFAVRFVASTQLPFVLDLDGIRDPGSRALFIGAVTVGATVTSLAYGALQKRLAPAGAFYLGLACMSIALTCLATGTTPIAALTGCVFMGLSSGVLGPYVYHVVSDHSASRSRGHALGMLGAFCFLGGFLNPLFAASIANAIGLRNLLLLVALCLGVMALTLFGRDRGRS